MAPAESICFCGNNLTQYRHGSSSTSVSNIFLCPQIFVSAQDGDEGHKKWQWVFLESSDVSSGDDVCPCTVNRLGPPDSKNVQIRRRWPSVAMLHH